MILTAQFWTVMQLLGGPSGKLPFKYGVATSQLFRDTWLNYFQSFCYVYYGCIITRELCPRFHLFLHGA
jgi:hypothetical protein